MRVTSIQIKNFKCFDDTSKINIGQVNVIVGRNNSGKSTIIQALRFLQVGFAIETRALRLRASTGEVVFDVRDWYDIDGAINVDTAELTVMLGRKDQPHLHLNVELYRTDNGSKTRISQVQPSEPDNLIYNYLSRRKVRTFDQVVNLEKTRSVNDDLQYLVSKVDRLANPDHPGSARFEKLCNDVFGFRVCTFPSEGGKQAGILIDGDEGIPLEHMGEGVSSLLGLISDLCVAREKLFLIEEPENDIHPQGLKAILTDIVENANNNQFVVSTHSNIVTKYLGSGPDAKILYVESNRQGTGMPTSTIVDIGSSTDARMQVLNELGYELQDLDLWEGWLILEESSAEVVIRDYLIRWFTPKLSRIRTISVNGSTNLGPTFEDFRRLFLFAHLEPRYHGRAWVVADGDDSGKKSIDKLRSTYDSWPDSNFQNWSQDNFERFYPARFEDQVNAALGSPKNEKRGKKKVLLEKVKTWCDENDEESRGEFEKSATEVIDLLRKIENELFPTFSETK